MLEEACDYSQVLFSGAIAIWLVNTLASVLRGTGDMRLPSATLIGAALVQIVVGGTLGLGLVRPAAIRHARRRRGAADRVLARRAVSALVPRQRPQPADAEFLAFTFQRGMFFDILKVGAVACLSPLQTVLTILIFTKILAGFGTETLAGYGMGSRLEFLLIPIAFAFGVASVPMVGMAIGAGLVTRARRVAWTAGAAAGLERRPGRPGRGDQTGALGLAVHQRSRRHRGGQFVFRMGGSGLRVFRDRRLPLFRLAGCGESRGPGAGVDHAAADGRRSAAGGWRRSNAPAWTLFALVGAAMVMFGLSTAAAIRPDALGQMIPAI